MPIWSNLFECTLIKFPMRLVFRGTQYCNTHRDNLVRSFCLRMFSISPFCHSILHILQKKYIPLLSKQTTLQINLLNLQKIKVDYKPESL